MRFLKLRYFYLLGLLFAFFLYLYPTILPIERQREWLNVYFGNLIYLLFFMLLLYGARMWTQGLGAKIAFEIRIYLFFLCILSFLYLFLFYQVGIDFHTREISDSMKEELLSLALYKYHLGLIGSYVLYLLSNLKRYPYFYYYYGLLTVCILSFFLLIYKPIKMKITTMLEERRIRVRRETERKLMMEQIRIKKALDKKEYNKKKKFEQRKTEMIYEKAKDLELGSLISKVNLLEEEEPLTKRQEKIQKKPLIQQKGEEEEVDFSLDIFAEELELKNKLEVEEE